MLIDVHLLDTSTGERRVYLHDYEWSDVESVRYQYGMGNYSCDCNRYLFFERATGRTGADDPYNDDYECGEDHFVIEKIVERGSEHIVYQDPPFDEATIRSGVRTLPKP